MPNAPIVNSIDYRETGVITEVTPRVNSGGLVTLDISQEVSNIDPNVTPQTTGINSPTFFERSVQSRVVVQDGQTIGLAGLIQDSSSRGNSGIPWLKDVPLLGFLAGTQNNTRTRTELLLLITPRVIHDQRDARAATEELRAGCRMPPWCRRCCRVSSRPVRDPGEEIRQRLKMESPRLRGRLRVRARACIAPPERLAPPPAPRPPARHPGRPPAPCPAARRRPCRRPRPLPPAPAPPR